MTYMELVQGLKKKSDIKNLDRFLDSFNIQIHDLNEEISSISKSYFRENFHSTGIGITDCWLVATAQYYQEEILSLDKRHILKAKGVKIRVAY